jgi:hypothetical protein
MAKEPKLPSQTKEKSLAERIMGNTKNEYIAFLDESVILQDRAVIDTTIPGINIALSGEVDVGFTSSITQWAGPSKHFKTLFALIQVRAYLYKYPDAICLLFDSEFGSPLGYFKGLGIDPHRVIHIPVLTLEELRHEMVIALSEVKRGDRIIMMVDSVGNLASKKETEDAGKSSDSPADMTRAKVAKSLFRLVTPHFALKDIPLVVVNHTYQTLEMFSKTVVGGGTGSVYGADNIFILGRQQDRPQGSDLLGYDFIINVEKSRYAREKSKIPIYVSFDKGLDKYSGMFDLAVAFGFIKSPKKGYYHKYDPITGEVFEDKQYRASDIEADEAFMKSMVYSDAFKARVKEHFKLPETMMITDDEV